VPPIVSSIEIARPPDHQQITENNPPKTWAARAIAGPIRAHADITVEPLNGGTRSRVTPNMKKSQIRPLMR
jgi:hypothetical protein